MKKDKKHLKPFMVNNSVRVFENKKIILQPDDNDFLEQLSAYRVKSISSTGMPIYSDENEHAIDALNLCLLAFEQNYGSLFKRVLSTTVAPILGIPMNDVNNVQSRTENKSNNSSRSINSVNIGSNTAYIASSGNKFGKSKMITRRSF